MKSQFDEEKSNVHVLPVAFNLAYQERTEANIGSNDESSLEDLSDLISPEDQIIYREFDYKKTIKEKYVDLEKFNDFELQQEINQMNYLEERVKLVNDMTNRLKYYLDDINMLVKSKKL